jgi:glycosyltransferase involved in cell wall biosynthesis
MPPSAEAPGAIPLVVHAQLTGLARRHDVTVLTAAGPARDELDAVERLRCEGFDVRAVRRIEPLGLERWRRRWRLASRWARGAWPWRTIWFWEPRLQPALDALVVPGAFDVVAVEDNAMGIYRYRRDVPAVLTEHEVRRPRPIEWRAAMPAEAARHALREADWRRWAAYERRTWAQFDRLHVFTRRDAAAVAEIAPELAARVRVTPFGVDVPPAPDERREEPGELLFVGNFTHPPNVDAALWLGREIMPRLRARKLSARLTLAGIYPPAEVRALGSADDVAVAGVVAEITPLFERAAVVLAPIRTGGGMRMKVLQALALGKPVVTTTRGAEGLADEGEPPLVLADDADAIAAATADLLQDERRRRDLGRRARSFVERDYSADAYGKRVEATYAEVVDERAGVREVERVA